MTLFCFVIAQDDPIYFKFSHLTLLQRGEGHQMPTFFRYGYHEQNCLGDKFDF